MDEVAASDDYLVFNARWVVCYWSYAAMVVALMMIAAVVGNCSTIKLSIATQQKLSSATK